MLVAGYIYLQVLILLFKKVGTRVPKSTQTSVGMIFISTFPHPLYQGCRKILAPAKTSLYYSEDTILKEPKTQHACLQL